MFIPDPDLYFLANPDPGSRGQKGSRIPDLPNTSPVPSFLFVIDGFIGEGRRIGCVCREGGEITCYIQSLGSGSGRFRNFLPDSDPEKIIWIQAARSRNEFEAKNLFNKIHNFSTKCTILKISLKKFHKKLSISKSLVYILKKLYISA
jgi:hypothetical protein